MITPRRRRPDTTFAGAAVAACLLAWSINLAYCQSVPTPTGEWRTFGDDGSKPRGVVRITESGGVFTGVIVRGLVPGEDPDKRCTRCTDARRDQRLNGMTIVTGMRALDAAGGEFGGGEILDPDTGSVYRSSMRLSADGRRLSVRGYVGIPLFGRSQEWIRVD